jgi:hypothetical protein
VEAWSNEGGGVEWPAMLETLVVNPLLCCESWH